MSRIDEVAYEFALTKEQATMFESYAHERFAGRMWSNAYEPDKSPNPESFYEQMASENLHAARVLQDLSLNLWNLDMSDIFNQLIDEEVRELVRGI